MPGDPVADLDDAKRRLAEIGWTDHRASMNALEGVLSAEREVARSRGEQYATELDIGVRWDVGAPEPHLVSNGSRAFVVCYVGVPDPDWDGTYVRVVAPSDQQDEDFGIIETWGCASLRIGSPNDEAITGHPLHGR